jgi:adenylate kinase
MSEFDDEKNIIEKTLGNETVSYTVSSESFNSIVREFENARIYAYAYVTNETSAFFVVKESDSKKAEEILKRL